MKAKRNGPIVEELDKDDKIFPFQLRYEILLSALSLIQFELKGLFQVIG